MNLGDTLSAVVPGVGAYLGAVEQRRAAESANRTNVYLAGQEMAFNDAEALEARQFSAAQARQQMDFQERMSNTSYQRAVVDMKKAGINPMFAIAQGGASSPSGAMASSPAASGTHATVMPLPSITASLISSAKDVISTYASFKQAMASADAARADASKTGVEEERLKKGMPQVETENMIYKWFGDFIKSLAASSAQSWSRGFKDNINNVINQGFKLYDSAFPIVEGGN